MTADLRLPILCLPATPYDRLPMTPSSPTQPSPTALGPHLQAVGQGDAAAAIPLLLCQCARRGVRLRLKQYIWVVQRLGSICPICMGREGAYAFGLDTSGEGMAVGLGAQCRRLQDRSSKPGSRSAPGTQPSSPLPVSAAHLPSAAAAPRCGQRCPCGYRSPLVQTHSSEAAVEGICR